MSNHLDLMDPMFNMYSGMFDNCSVAARQMWGGKGLWIPETVFFDGLGKLPEYIAAEVRDLFLLRNSWDDETVVLLKKPKKLTRSLLQFGIAKGELPELTLIK